jgi:DNA-binding IclR family transcriptional regulator
MVFSNGGSYSLTELARLAGLPVSTTHRLVGELTSRRLLERAENGAYRVGLPLRMLGAAPAEISLLERAGDVLADLSAATRSTVRLGVLHDMRVAYVEVRPGVAPPSRFTGVLLPGHTTALGRVLLAFSPTQVVDDVVAAWHATVNAGTMPVPDSLRRSLGVTRVTRVALSRDEPTPGACLVAMPVFGPGGDVVAALQLAVADQRAGLASARAALVVATGSLSRQLAMTPTERASPSDAPSGQAVWPSAATGGARY